MILGATGVGVVWDWALLDLAVELVQGKGMAPEHDAHADWIIWFVKSWAT